MGRELKIFADGPKRFERVNLRDHVELAAYGEQNIAQREGLEMAGGAAGGATHAFSHGSNLSFFAGKKRDDAVGLAEVHTFENDRRCAVQPAARHALARQHTRQGLDHHPAVLGVDVFDDVFDGWDENFTACAADHVDIVRAGL